MRKRTGWTTVLAATLLFGAVSAPVVVAARSERDGPASPAEALAQIEAIVNRLQRESAARKLWLSSAEAIAQRENSQSAFAMVSGSQARDLLERKFAEPLGLGEDDSLVDPAQVDNYLGPHTALLAGDHPQLVDSTLPLQAHDESGDKRPVDFSLEDKGARFAPDNPLVEVSLPDAAGGAIEVGGADGVGIELAGARPTAQAMALGEDSLFYPDVHQGTDLVVSAKPTGIELSTQIRSPKAPETERYRLDLPEGAVMREAPDGTIAIFRDEQQLGRVSYPVATDAQGQPVPVSMRAEGRSIAVETDFHGGDYALPILVDPVVETYQNPGPWTNTWSSNYKPPPPFEVCPGGDPNVCNWQGPTTLWIAAPTGTYPAAAVGEKYWTAPHGVTDPATGVTNPASTTASIESASFGAVSYWGATTPLVNPLLWAGITDASGVNWTDTELRWASAGNFNGTLDLQGSAASKQLHFGMRDLFTSAPSNHPNDRYARFGYATVSLTDPEAPSHSITNITFPSSGWVSGGTYGFDAAASDPGLGVQKIQLYRPTVADGLDFGEETDYELASEQGPTPACTGGRQAPCPQTINKHFDFGVGQPMAEGRNKLYVKTLDPLGGTHVAQSTTEIRVDRSGPKLELTGTLAEAPKGELDAKSYVLTVKARDGSAESPSQERSGVKDIKVYLDDLQASTAPVAQWASSGCPQSSCEGELQYTLDAAALAPGSHTLQIRSRDWAAGTANEAVKTLYLSVEGQAGVILAPKGGDSTARRFAIEAERIDQAMTGVTLQYRRPGTMQWSDIPLAQLRLADGSAPSAYPLPLDSQSGRSPVVTWNVPPTPGINGVDGAVSIRARFEGASGPPAVPGDNPALLWRLGEDEGTLAADASGNDRTGAYVGDPPRIADGALSGPDDDGAVDLDGSNDYIQTDYAPFASSASRTFTGWARRDTESSLDVLVSGEDPGQTLDSPNLVLGGASGLGARDVRWRPHGNSGAQYPAFNAIWANAWPGPNVWVHWALVHNAASGLAEFFVDGASQGTRQVAAGYTTPAAPARFGAWRAGTSAYDPLDGKLDELAVYERALTQAEVQSHMGGIHKGFSQVVPLTLDRDDTTSKHASAPVGPGTVDLMTGNFAVSADDVSVASYGSELTLSRTHNSREPAAGALLSGLGPGWVTSLPVDAAGSDYTGLLETGPAGDPQAAIKIVASDSTEILFTRKGGDYEVEPLYSGMGLIKLGSGSESTYVLKDLGGNSTTFYKPPTSQAPQYVPLKVSQTGHAARTTTRYGYETGSWSLLQPGIRPAFALAPTPAGVSCTTGSAQNLQLLDPLPRGCRALKFHYSTMLTSPPSQGSFGAYPGQLDKVSFHAWDPNGQPTAGMVAVDVARYDYGSDGRLHAAWDPRISPAPKTTYAYDAAGHLTSFTPPGENAWTLAYESPTSTDPNTGRLKSASRAVPGAGTATSTVVYDVPLSGSGAPYPMAPQNVDDWAQSDAPADATAIFPPDQVPAGTPPSSYERATITYMNRNGDAVNVAAPGGEISTTEYEKNRMVRRTLTPGNRARALASGDPAATAQALDTQMTYNADATELTETLGPKHQVVLDSGQVTDARRRTVTSYDEGAPSGHDYHLPTTVQSGARIAGQPSDADVRTTKSEYAWALRQPTAVTVDPGSGKLNLVTTTSYDSATGLPTERRLPKANASGTDAYTTKTIYYSAAANSSHPECGGKPEWANLACKELPGGQPVIGSAPDLPITIFEYNIWNQVTTATEDVPGATPSRVTATTFDLAGRPDLTSVSGGQGTAVPTVDTNYDQYTGRVTTTSSSAGTITRGYDSIGRQTTYTDADGKTATTTYDGLSRPTAIIEEKGATTFAYDATTGRPSSMTDTGVGTFSATYDADGNVTSETLPNQTAVSMTFNSVGEPTYRGYMKSSCSSNCGVMAFSASRSIHGQVTAETSYTGAGLTLHESDSYIYDAASRLTRAYNWLDGPGCTRRDYGYDADSNRTSAETVAPLSGGGCNTTGSGTVSTQTYDEADRIIDSGYTYDDFGRTLGVPAADAGGTTLSASYYVDDMVRTLTQAGVTRTFSMDPARRVRVRATNGQPDEVYHYADDSDSSSWIEKGGPNSDWERYVSGLSGTLAAVEKGHGSTIDQVRFELTNLHGDVVGEADTAGNVTASFDADEFGVPQSSLPGSGYGWLGGSERRSQFATGVISMGARVYVPQIGRFLQTDPVKGGSANAYDYVNQDPLDQLDLAGTAPNRYCAASRAACRVWKTHFRDRGSGLGGLWRGVKSLGRSVGSWAITAIKNAVRAARTAVGAAWKFLRNDCKRGILFAAGGAAAVAVGSALFVSGVGIPAGTVLIGTGAEVAAAGARTVSTRC